jgi:leader peptidase (prepilin peptidase)/N-methyltransferase
MSVAYTVFFGAIALLVTINRKHQLLPDTIVLAVLWLGLLCQVLWGDPESAILGAAVGYIVPFAIHLAFKAATGKDGLGCGDMKCMAMSGAWMGFNGVAVALVAFAVATVLMGILAVYLAKHDSQKAIATGPAHLIAALAAFIFISTH